MKHAASAYLNPQPVPPRTMAATSTAPAMEPIMILVPLGPGPGRRGQGHRSAGTGPQDTPGTRLCPAEAQSWDGWGGSWGHGGSPRTAHTDPCIAPSRLWALARGWGRRHCSPSPSTRAGRCTCPHCCRPVRGQREHRAMAPRTPASPPCPHPMVKTDLPIPAAGTGAEVKGCHWKAFMVKTQHAGPAGRPVLHVAQVRAIHQLHVAAPAGGQQGGDAGTPAPQGGPSPVPAVAPTCSPHSGFDGRRS